VIKFVENYFADSSFLIDLSKGEEETLNYVDNGENISTSILCVYELCKLSHFDPSQLNPRILKKVELRDVEKAGKIFRDLRYQGDMINQSDILIAAQAVNRDQVLLTADRDFKKIKEVETRFYREI
jgi:predicted nucleic acid-binding protein